MTYTVRKLTGADLHPGKGFYETLSNLSTVGPIGHEHGNSILEDISARDAHVFIAVQPDGTIIGTTTLLVERKFIHAGGWVGHIEDVATRKDHEGKGVGKSLIAAAVAEAEKRGCYKVILDCSEQNIPFYEKTGFKRYEICMRRDL